MYSNKTIVLCGNSTRPLRRKKVLDSFDYLGAEFVVTYDIDSINRDQNKYYSVSESTTGLLIVSAIIEMEDCPKATARRLNHYKIDTQQKMLERVKRSKNWSYLTNPYLVAIG